MTRGFELMTSEKDKGFNEELKIEETSEDNTDEIRKELEHLRAENEMLKKKKADNITFKVGQKGGMSMYGIGRFPVTLYKSQWLILLDATDKIRGFLKDHDHELK
jgi:hypothetical protein